MADVQTSLEGGAKPTNWGNIKFDQSTIFIPSMTTGIPSPNIQLDPREQGKGFPIAIAVNPTDANAPIKVENLPKSLLKKISGSNNQNLYVAFVLVAGYFAYKKFKK